MISSIVSLYVLVFISIFSFILCVILHVVLTASSGAKIRARAPRCFETKLGRLPVRMLVFVFLKNITIYVQGKDLSQIGTLKVTSLI